MNLTKLATLIVASLLTIPAIGQTWMGLAPSTNSRARAEAVTSTAQGTDVLFYNPALISRQRLSVRVIGAELNADESSVQLARKAYQQRDDLSEFSLADVYTKFNSDKPTFLSSTIRALDIVTPFAAVSSFVNLHGRSYFAQVGEEASDESYYDINFGTDFGVIGGVGFSIGGLSIGYSQYVLTRAQINTRPTNAVISEIRSAAENDSFNEETAAFRDFTDFRYGGAGGSNVGLAYFFWEDNPSAIAVSVLNIGNTRFSEDTPIDRDDFKKIETKLQEEADVYQIDLLLPETIPEITNMGANLGYDQPEGLLKAGIALDYHDVNGTLIQKKAAASYHFGIQIPDRLALVTSKIIYKRGEKAIHGGFLGARVFGGVRPGSHSSEGIGLTFHLGYAQKVSVVKIDIEGFRTHVLKDDAPDIVATVGARATVGLTLIF